MQIVLPDMSARRILVESDRPMTDDEFFDFCMEHPQWRIERTAGGEIVIMPPAGGETGYRNSDLTAQLTVWAKRDGRGRAFDSNTEYLLPSGAALSPDGSWVLAARLNALSKEQKRRFLPLCPDFVIELISPSDRLIRVKEKMREWMENGAQLGWLIDADGRTVYIYRRESEPEERVDIESLAGEGPVEGFTLHLTDIWQGL